MTVAVAILAVLIIVGGSVAFFRAKRNAEKAATRRVENAKLAHDAMIREENRQSAYAGRVVRPPKPQFPQNIIVRDGEEIGVAMKRKAKPS